MSDAGSPAWRRVASLDVPSPPVGDGWQRPDVLVVGGGIAGLATAAWCRWRGFDRVVVVERGALAAGPSGRAAGALIPDVHALTHPPAFTRLARRGLALHRELAARWGRASSLRSITCRVEPPKVDMAIELPEQGLVDPCALAAGLAAGTLALTGVEVTGWEAPAGRISTVHTSAGPISPAAVVLATGTVDALAASRTKGHLIATAPLPVALDHVVAADIVVLPRADGSLIAGGTFDLDDDPAVRLDVVATIRAALARLVPEAAGMEVRHAWTCFRPAVADGLPLVDRLPGVTNGWQVGGLNHTGLLTAPAIAESLAAWIESGECPEALAPFSSARLATGPPARAGTATTPPTG